MEEEGNLLRRTSEDNGILTYKELQTSAAFAGDLHVLVDLDEIGFPPTVELYADAAWRARVNVFEWLSHDKDIHPVSYIVREMAMCAAARRTPRMEVFEWIHGEYTGRDPPRYMLAGAIRANSTIALGWCHDKEFDLSDIYHPYENAADAHASAAMGWLVDHNVPCLDVDFDHACYALGTSRLDDCTVTEELLASVRPFDYEAMLHGACAIGNASRARRCIEAGGEWSLQTATAAARGLHREVFLVAKAAGKPLFTTECRSMDLHFGDGKYRDFRRFLKDLRRSNN